ncbi:alpha/beta hydrolase [Streptomyces olindensis]|uniref:Alpha/beta hydrolase n=1 Tax=Streptomyces olindensis TaxID=358823 RepID=A0ABV2Y589_9ACTN
MEASTCAYWHHRPGHRAPLDTPAAPPVLLVASAHDPVTPVRGAAADFRRRSETGALTPPSTPARSVRRSRR